jgi:hypothetical protein
MISTTTFVLAALLAGSGQTILLDFYSDSCAPCVSMEPTLRRLASEGFDVRRVHVNNSSSWSGVLGSSRFRRISRWSKAARWIAWWDRPATSGCGRCWPRAKHRQHGRAVCRSRRTRLRCAARPCGSHRIQSARPATRNSERCTPVSGCGSKIRRATVLARGRSFTAKARSPGDHLRAPVPRLFRPGSDPGGSVRAGRTQSGGGQLLCYDLKNDVALVIIWPGMPVTPVQVAPENHRIQPGDRVFSIGCDRGADATIRVSQVNSVNKYLGPANIQVAANRSSAAAAEACSPPMAS